MFLVHVFGRSLTQTCSGEVTIRNFVPTWMPIESINNRLIYTPVVIHIPGMDSKPAQPATPHTSALYHPETVTVIHMY